MLEKNVTTAQIETTTTQCMQEILQQMYFIKMTKIQMKCNNGMAIIRRQNNSSLHAYHYINLSQIIYISVPHPTLAP